MGQMLVAVAVLGVGLVAFPPIAEAQTVTGSQATGYYPYAVAVNPVRPIRSTSPTTTPAR